MPLDFPNDPAVGDIFAGAGARWQWDGFKWTSLMTSGGPFLPLSGGALTGPLMLAADPVVALHAATKQYVDGYLPLTGGTLAGPLTVEGILEVTTGHLQLINDGSTEDAFAYVDLSADIGGMNLIRGHSPGFALTWWTLALGDGPPSADFSITRYNDAGGIIDHPLTISRATGVVTFGPVPPTVLTRRSGAAPGTTAVGGVGSLQGHTVNGTVIQGNGSATDFLLNNKNGTAVMSVPTGTTTVNFAATPTAGGAALPFLPMAGGTVTGQTIVNTTSSQSLVVRTTDANTALVISNQTANNRFALNTLASGGWTIFEYGSGGAKTAISANNGIVTIPLLTGAALSNQALGGGGTLNAYVSYAGTLSGKQTAGAAQMLLIQNTADTMQSSGGLYGGLFNVTAGGVGTTGNRIALRANLNIGAGITNKAGGTGAQYGGVWAYAVASGNQGGATGTGNAWGTLWGGIFSASLTSGATFWAAAVGAEVDIGVAAGASASVVEGLKIGLIDHDQPPGGSDYLIGMAAAANRCTNWSPMGISFGSSDGVWPFDPAGTMIGTIPSNVMLPGIRTYTAAYGINLNAVTFSVAAFSSTGFLVDGSGNAKMARAGFNNTTPIAKPTVSGAKASNAALASLIAALASYGLITDTTTA